MRRIAVVFIIAACITATAEARILRVNNVDGKAPYSTIAAAVRAANDGDTIMVDGSSVKYESTKITKRLVLLGPGYFLRENGIATEAESEAVVDGLEIEQAGTVIKGMHIGGWHSLDIKAPGVVISRCYIASWEGVMFHQGADNCVLHQNYLVDDLNSEGKTYYHQITNNICKNLGISDICGSLFYYNTVYGENPTLHNATDNRLEKNFVRNKQFGQDDTTNTYRDNISSDEDYLFADVQTDLDVQNRMSQLPSAIVSTYGAFAGTAPYIISGVPTAPVIESITLPASVEEGGKMTVTIKLGQGR